MLESCIFCKIIQGTIPAKVVHRDDRTMVFFPMEMNVKGHVIILPTEHFNDIFSIPEDQLRDLIIKTKKLASEVKQRLGATGVNILHASGRSAQQSVFHFHIHLLPRFENDGVDAWPNLSEWHGDREVLLSAFRIVE